METGTHSPWVSRVLTELGHEVIVAHAQKVRLIVKSRRKDDRLDARTLARLARIGPKLLSPVQHRSAQAQLHLADSGRVAMQDVWSGCSRGGGTRARASHRCTSAKREMSIYGRYGCKGHTTFWDGLEKKLAPRGGKNSKKRTVVAVARKPTNRHPAWH